MILTVSKHCIVREWRQGDEFSLAENANNKHIFNNLKDAFPHPYTLEDAKSWLSMTTMQPKPPTLLAIAVDDKAIGSIGAYAKEDIYRKSMELGYFIGEPYWNQGIATNCIKVFTRFLFDNFDIVRVFAEVFANNMSSRRVLEKSGYTFEAILRKSVCKNGQILDSCIYSILKEEIKNKENF